MKHFFYFLLGAMSFPAVTISGLVYYSVYSPRLFWSRFYESAYSLGEDISEMVIDSAKKLVKKFTCFQSGK